MVPVLRAGRKRRVIRVMQIVKLDSTNRQPARDVEVDAAPAAHSEFPLIGKVGRRRWQRRREVCHSYQEARKGRENARCVILVLQAAEGKAYAHKIMVPIKVTTAIGYEPKIAGCTRPGEVKGVRCVKSLVDVGELNSKIGGTMLIQVRISAEDFVSWLNISLRGSVNAQQTQRERQCNRCRNDVSRDYSNTSGHS